MQHYISTPAGNMEGTLDEMRLTAKMEHASIDLTLEAVGYPLYNGGTGKFHMVGMDIYEYSIPTIRTNGTITIDGTAYTIKNGYSWYDRQWQQKLPKMLPARSTP